MSNSFLQSELPWWKRTTVYQIYPRSFADKSGDGIGDLPGVIDRLDYVQWLGVETIWLSPFFQSPQVDFGYDISNHYEIAPEYGTLDECRRLIDEIHARGMKVVLDMVLNHTSDQHPWFVESASSRNNAYRDFYIWRDGRKPYGGAPPNNWRSMLGGSGWHYHERTDQWYWASFLPFQPDLNYRNPKVKQALLDVVRHWLREGADGLRLDIFNAIFKDPAFADNPKSLRALPSEDNPGGFFQRALYNQNHPDTFAFARELRAVVDEFDDPPRFMVGEVFGSPDLLREYCGPSGEGLHLVFLFKSLRTPFRAEAVRDLVSELEAAFPEPLYPTYVFGNHDRPRQMERLGNDPARARLLAAFQMTVRGVPFVYYGDELGLGHHAMPRQAASDPLARRFRFIPKPLLARLRKHGILTNRDECRSPMPWHAGPNAGFAPPEAASTWLPLHPQSAITNVAGQKADPTSVLSSYRRMLQLRRRSLALSSGRLELIEPPANPKKVLAYRRTYENAGGRETADIFLNFSGRHVPLDLRHLPMDPGTRLHSNLHDRPVPGRGKHMLRPWEAAVVLHEALA
jgi:oligo-1,6-glucosidase/alpha-glucosidase